MSWADKEKSWWEGSKEWVSRVRAWGVSGWCTGAPSEQVSIYVFTLPDACEWAPKFKLVLMSMNKLTHFQTILMPASLLEVKSKNWQKSKIRNIISSKTFNFLFWASSKCVTAYLLNLAWHFRQFLLILIRLITGWILLLCKNCCSKFRAAKFVLRGNTFLSSQ